MVHTASWWVGHFTHAFMRGKGGELFDLKSKNLNALYETTPEDKGAQTSPCWKG